MTKGHWITYSAAEWQWLEANRAMVISDYHRKFCEAFERDDISAANLHALRKRRGWLTGRTGHFPKGNTPFNKGTHFCPPGCEKGQFKKGNLPHNTNYLGHERVSKDGYVEISIDETNPHTGFERRYVLKHKHLWERKNGPVPEGFALKCLDSDKLNVDPSNWEPVPRALLPTLNGGRNKKHIAYDEAAQELKPTVLVLAKLRHRARAIRKRSAAP
jgi:hypothetical protein